MPAIDMSPADAAAVAAYVRSVMETIGRQGMPPSIGQAAPSVLVGNAGEGQAYFDAKCASCHSADRRSARASRPESPIPRCCRTPGWPAAAARRTGRTRRRRRRAERAHRNGRRHAAIGRTRGRPAGPHRRLPGDCGTGRRNAAHLPPGRRRAESGGPRPA